MKTQNRISTLPLFTILCLTLLAIPSQLPGQGATHDILNSFAANNLNPPADTYWLNLNDGLGTEYGLGMYWDTSRGVGCGGSDGRGANCPSSGYFDLTGPIPSESFTIDGSPSGTTPEPSSLALFGSGVLGLGGLLRRRFLG